MSKFILAFTKKSSNISKPYFDTLYSWGFSGVGADGSFDLSLLNGVEWERVTNTSISEAENDGFINEVWHSYPSSPSGFSINWETNYWFRILSFS